MRVVKSARLAYNKSDTLPTTDKSNVAVKKACADLSRGALSLSDANLIVYLPNGTC